jgi:hypothetical protein
MTNTKELDRLDKLVAETIGWPITNVPPGNILLVMDEDLWGQSFVFKNGTICYRDHVWSPTRNAADRDAVVEWIQKKKRLFVKIAYWPDSKCGVEIVSIHADDEMPEILSAEPSCETPGEAVCRAVE